MNLLDDVLAVMDKHLETSNKHTDRNSLGKLKIQKIQKNRKKTKIVEFFGNRNIEFHHSPFSETANFSPNYCIMNMMQRPFTLNKPFWLLEVIQNSNFELSQSGSKSGFGRVCSHVIIKLSELRFWSILSLRIGPKSEFQADWKWIKVQIRIVWGHVISFFEYLTGLKIIVLVPQSQNISDPSQFDTLDHTWIYLVI